VEKKSSSEEKHLCQSVKKQFHRYTQMVYTDTHRWKAIFNKYICVHLWKKWCSSVSICEKNNSTDTHRCVSQIHANENQSWRNICVNLWKQYLCSSVDKMVFICGKKEFIW